MADFFAQQENEQHELEDVVGGVLALEKKE
jgi:hypothetical protein